MLNSLKGGVLEINETTINSDQEDADQELHLLKDLKLQVKEISQRKKSRKQSKKAHLTQ